MVRFEMFVWMIFMVVWIFCLLDVIATTDGLARNLPKMTWLFIVFFGWIIGAGAWLWLGRPERAGYRPGDTTYRKPINLARGPDDKPDFLNKIGSGSSAPSVGAGAKSPEELDKWEAELARREELIEREAELKRREDEVRRREQGEG
jgi:hypothetical protein